MITNDSHRGIRMYQVGLSSFFIGVEEDAAVSQIITGTGERFIEGGGLERERERERERGKRREEKRREGQGQGQGQGERSDRDTDRDRE